MYVSHTDLMADLDHNFSEVEHAHESEYQHEDEDEDEHEHEHEHEFVPALELHEIENEEHTNISIEGIPENLESDEKQDHEDISLAGGAEKWPGWPGESVFRMLVPAQKVGSIIGRKGEYIKKTCEETKARIKILDGPPGTRERAVSKLISRWLKFYYLALSAC